MDVLINNAGIDKEDCPNDVIDVNLVRQCNFDFFFGLKNKVLKKLKQKGLYGIH